MHELRRHLIKLLHGGQAFDSFDHIVSEFLPSQRFAILNGAERSAWQILEHLRLALRDIHDFSTNEDGHYVELKWPDELWRDNPLNGDEMLWNETVNGYRAEKSEFERLIDDPKRELFAQFPWGDGQTLCREAMLVAEHEAHHLGQLMMLLRMLS